MRNIIVAALLLVACETVAQKEITVDDFTTKNTFVSRSVRGINWMNDGKFYSTLANNKILKNDITTGQVVETIVDGSTLSSSLDISRYAFSEDENKILLLTDFESIYRRSYTANYFLYDTKTKSVTPLSKGGKQSYASFSSNGERIAFVRDNNLFMVNVADMKETQVTTDGKFNHIINGTTDWVYEEEFGFVNGFYWSPDGSKLAYYRFDESDVKEYNMQVWNTGQPYPEDYRFKYPKAGEKNSKVEIWIYDVPSGKKVKADVGSENDIYIPRVMWTTDSNVLSVRKMNRLQNQLEIFHVNASSGESNVVLAEKSETYVDVESIDDLTYLNDGKHFIHSSERSGFKHLYLYSVDGKLIRQITTGNFEVLEYKGVNEKSKTLYYTSTEVSPLEKHFYSINLEGKKKTKLSGAAGTHNIVMSDDFQFYIDTYSNVSQPATATLFSAKNNSTIKTLETNQELNVTIKEYSLAKKEFFTFKTVDGTELNGYMLKPDDFDATKKYPLLVYQYSGPGSQNANNSFAGSHYYFHQLLVQKGYIVAVIDPRGTGRRGEQFKKITYKQLGKYELEDMVAGGKYLGSLNYVDENRLGIWGWSYGGYMSSLVMTKGGGVFSMGIAVAPVTNWRYYDTVYTERYLQTPQLNASGYDDNSPSFFAEGLKGKFLLIHGTGDDNVHFQNSVVLQNALIDAGKHFESFYYPDKNHSIPGAKTKHHLYTMMTDFVLANL